MKFSDRIKTYNFWVSIASAILLIINLFGKIFNFTIDESVYNDIVTTFCSVLVLLGIIVPPTNSKGQVEHNKNNDLAINENGFEDNKAGEETLNESQKSESNTKDEEESEKN